MRRVHVSDLPQTRLTAGEPILLSGFVYTARDAAHKRIAQALSKGEEPPFPIMGSVIYYAGPTPAPPGRVIGSCGPTTSGRMDSYAPALYDLGLSATVGKGQRDVAVRGAIARNRALYLCAVGGAGALIASKVISCEAVAYEDLGCEAVHRLEFADLPLIVAIDREGNDLFNFSQA